MNMTTAIPLNTRSWRFTFPPEVDTRSLWAFVESMGWTQYVEAEPAPTERRCKNVDIDSLCGILPDTGEPYKEMILNAILEKEGEQV